MSPALAGGFLTTAPPGKFRGFFQITASALGLGACEILHVPFKREVCFLHPSASPICKPHWTSKPDVLGALAAPLGWGARCMAWTPHSLGRTSAIVIIFPFVCHLLEVCVLTVLRLCPFCTSCWGYFFISLVWEIFSAIL